MLTKQFKRDRKFVPAIHSEGETTTCLVDYVFMHHLHLVLLLRCVENIMWVWRDTDQI